MSVSYHASVFKGLLSAAKAVGVAARVLVDSADGVVTGQGVFLSFSCKYSIRHKH